MFEVSGGITPRALASSNSLAVIHTVDTFSIAEYMFWHLSNNRNFKFWVLIFGTYQGRDFLSRPPFLLSPDPKFETSPVSSIRVRMKGGYIRVNERELSGVLSDRIHLSSSMMRS